MLAAVKGSSINVLETRTRSTKSSSTLLLSCQSTSSSPTAVPSVCVTHLHELVAYKSAVLAAQAADGETTGEDDRSGSRGATASHPSRGDPDKLIQLDVPRLSIVTRASSSTETRVGSPQRTFPARSSPLLGFFLGGGIPHPRIHSTPTGAAIVRQNGEISFPPTSEIAGAQRAADGPTLAARRDGRTKSACRATTSGRH